MDRLAKDRGTKFPGVDGFSLRNLRYMRSFAQAWPDPEFCSLLQKLPWGHHMVLLDRLKDGQRREWYLQASIEHGWSRNVTLVFAQRRIATCKRIAYRVMSIALVLRDQPAGTGPYTLPA